MGKDPRVEYQQLEEGCGDLSQGALIDELPFWVGLVIIVGIILLAAWTARRFDRQAYSYKLETDDHRKQVAELRAEVERLALDNASLKAGDKPLVTKDFALKEVRELVLDAFREAGRELIIEQVKTNGIGGRIETSFRLDVNGVERKTFASEELLVKYLVKLTEYYDDPMEFKELIDIALS